MSAWRSLAASVLSALLLSTLAGSANAQRLDDGSDQSVGSLQLPSGVERRQDLPYGPHPRQRMDVDLPPHPSGAPIILMVHGGAWMFGDKAMPNVVENKVAHWVGGRGVIFVSMNYRFAPAVTPAQQAEDVAQALAKVQSSAASWGGDPHRVVLMGHSAGAHLVALVDASPSIASKAGATPWLGTVVLDSAALDLSALMHRRHARFYDRAFGDDPSAWPGESPTDSLSVGALPLLLVCSTRRADDSCGQTEAFARRVQAMGVRVSVSRQALTHAEVNASLGQPGSETGAVDAFLASLGF